MESVHVINESELASLVNEINQQLADDPSVADLLPIDPPSRLWDAVSNGLLLSKLINATVEDSPIDDAALNMDPKTPFAAAGNHNICINGARKIGCKITNIGANDLMKCRAEHTEHLVLGILWQIIKVGLMDKLTVTKHPELIRLIRPGEDLSAFLNMPPEQLLMRWVNYHLEHAGSPRKISNFSEDVADSEVYATLLHQISPGSLDPETVLAEADLLGRAEGILVAADKLGCRRFVTPQDIVAGETRLNLAFVANLFNHHPGIQLPTEDELSMLNQSKAQMYDSLQQLQAEKQKQEAEIASLEAENGSLLAKLSATEESLRQETASGEQLSQSLEEVRSKLDGTGTERDLLQERSTTLQAKLAETEAQVAALGEAKTEAEERLANVQQQLGGQINELSASITKLEQKLRESQEETQRVQASADQELENAKGRLSQSIDTSALLKEQIRKLTEALIKVTRERDEALKRVKAYEDANQRGLQAYEKVKMEKEGAANLLQELSTRNHVLQAELRRNEELHKTEVADLNARIGKLEADLSSAHTAKDLLQGEHNELRESHVSLTKKAKALDAMVVHMKNQIQRNETHVDHLKQLYNLYPSAKKLAHALYPDWTKHTMLQARQVGQLGGLLLRLPQGKDKEPKMFYYILMDNFLFGYKQDDDHKPHEILRIDDALLEKYGATDSQHISITPIHDRKEPYSLQMESEEQLRVWYAKLLVAVEWWADNKLKRSRVETAARESR